MNLIDLEPGVDDFRQALLEGLASTPKRVPCKFLYDVDGSDLFEEICRLPEYYPTRTELGILRKCAPEISYQAGPACEVVELGSGSCTKTRLLLDHLERPAAYIPVEISRGALLSASQRIASLYPGLEIVPVCADYTRSLRLDRSPQAQRRVYFFPGSTIGNFEPGEAGAFLRRLASQGKAGDLLIIGVDLKKSPQILEAAYNDARGVTARFNLNLLARANREAGADFNLAAFRHHAWFNPHLGRIEMHLVSPARQQVRVGGRAFPFLRGEPIITEFSYKYRIDEFQNLARCCGFVARCAWTDPDGRFSVHALEIRPSSGKHAKK